MGYRLSDDELQRLMNVIGGNHDSVSRSTIMASQIDWRHLQVRDMHALHAPPLIQAVQSKSLRSRMHLELLDQSAMLKIHSIRVDEPECSRSFKALACF